MNDILQIKNSRPRNGIFCFLNSAGNKIVAMESNLKVILVIYKGCFDRTNLFFLYIVYIANNILSKLLLLTLKMSTK